MSTSNPTFSTAKASAADAHTLALIASSLVAATAIAFVAMVVTAWPAKASERVQMAALPSAVILNEAMTPAPARPADPAPVRTAALGTLPMPAQPCTEALAAAETEMNATLAKVEALSEAEMGAQCSAFRVHMSSLQRAASTVDRCVAGQDRSTKAGFIRQSLAEWRGVIANGCR
ncbi:MAG: hypothetical protein LCH88_22720 [Proteobacteria bacterium]|nr:hypothetical protein [Pseudomonadota bacterium]